MPTDPKPDATPAIAPDPEALRRVAEEVWASMLGMSLTGEPEPPPAPGSPTVTGTIEIGGAWEGKVDVRCSEALARRAAAAMFGMAPEDVTEAEIADALGEIANMAGGNLKALLPSGSKLSLPHVTSDQWPEAKDPEACYVSHACEGESVQHTLQQKKP